MSILDIHVYQRPELLTAREVTVACEAITRPAIFHKERCPLLVLLRDDSAKVEERHIRTSVLELRLSDRRKMLQVGPRPSSK
jgi:hypothetical protein